ncbi:MAG: SAM-dependent methyltransferase [Acidobacteriota bacterium]
MPDGPKVFLLGVNPSDPDLLTRKAERVLRRAAAVIHDSRVDLDILALVNPNARVVPLTLEGSQEEIQAEVCASFLRLRDIGGDIVRVAVQDCLAMGDGNEELEFLMRHDFAVEVIPGVLPETVFACRLATRTAPGSVKVS